MAFESIMNRLIPEGSVAAGLPPKTILADGTGGGSEPGYYDTSRLGNLLRSIEETQAAAKIKAEEEMKKQKDRADMYKTLRDAGYEPSRAFEAIQKNALPQEPGGKTLKEKESEAKTTYYEAQTAKVNAAKEKLNTVPSQRLRERILEKVANGEDLTVGEQKVYDENIRKYGKKGTLESVSKKEPKVDNTDYVPMVNPQGQNKLVPSANVSKALARGWKKR